MLVQREIRQQALRLVLAPDEVHRPGTAERRLQDAPGDQLGHVVRDPHREALGPPRGAAAQSVGQLGPDREDLVGVPEYERAQLGGGQPATLPLEELAAEGLLERAELPADRRLRHPQLRARGRDPALLEDRPEVEEVVVVELAVHRKIR